MFRVRSNVALASGGTYEALESRCKECESLSQREWFATPAGKKTKKERRARTRQTIRGWLHERVAGWRKKTPASDLTTEHLVDLFEKQNGLCYFTGVPLKLGVHAVDADGISLDKLTPALGYMTGNVVFCTFSTNTMKGALTEAEFYEKMRLILSKHPQTIGADCGP
jgi:hypothetical protein